MATLTDDSGRSLGELARTSPNPFTRAIGAMSNSDAEPGFIHACAWCPDTPRGPNVTHGICPSCLAKLLNTPPHIVRADNR